MPGGTQSPQLALQQVRPAPQVANPQVVAWPPQTPFTQAAPFAQSRSVMHAWLLIGVQRPTCIGSKTHWKPDTQSRSLWHWPVGEGLQTLLMQASPLRQSCEDMHRVGVGAPRFAPREQPAPATQEARSPALFGLGWGLVGLGVGGVVGGSYLLGLDGDTTCSTGEVWQCPRVFNTTFEGSMLLGAGAISLTSGVFLIVDNWGGEAAQPSQPSGATLQLAPTPGGGLVGLSTRF